MRSLLFVPADGGTKLGKAMTSGADGVIVDLEDSIAPERKEAARKLALDFLKAHTAKKERPRLLVRINGLDTGMTDADLDLILGGDVKAMLESAEFCGVTIKWLQGIAALEGDGASRIIPLIAMSATGS